MHTHAHYIYICNSDSKNDDDNMCMHTSTHELKGKNLKLSWYILVLLCECMLVPGPQ